MPSEGRAKMHNSFLALPERYEDKFPHNSPDMKDLYDLDSMAMTTGIGGLGSAAAPGRGGSSRLRASSPQRTASSCSGR